MVKKGQNNSGRALPPRGPPHSGNARKKTFFWGEVFPNRKIYFKVEKGHVFLGSKGAFETRAACGEPRTTDKKTMKNVTVTPKASCRGWVSINGMKGKRDEWATLTQHSDMRMNLCEPSRGTLYEPKM